MSLWKLPKDCFYHLMSFLPCPRDKRRLVFAVDTEAARSAFKEPSLWRPWEALNIMDPLFMRYPKAITMVLDNVKKIKKVSLNLVADENLFPVYQMIDSIEESHNKIWDVSEFEINVPNVQYTGREFIDLMSVVLQKLGTSVLTLNFNVRQRPLGSRLSAVDTLFRCIIGEGKFKSTAVLRFNVFGWSIRPYFEEALNQMSVKYLSITGVQNVLSTCLNGVIGSLEKLSVVDCNSVLAEVMIETKDAYSFPLMLQVGFTSKSLTEAMKWSRVCRQCFRHCSYDIVVTQPIDAFPENDFVNNLQWFHMKQLLRFFIETEMELKTCQGLSHNLTIGQRCSPPSLDCSHIRSLKLWMEQFSFKEERSKGCLKFRVKENCRIVLLWSVV